MHRSSKVPQTVSAKTVVTPPRHSIARTTTMCCFIHCHAKSRPNQFVVHHVSRRPAERNLSCKDTEQRRAEKGAIVTQAVLYCSSLYSVHSI